MTDRTELRRLAEACPMPDFDPDTLSEWYELEDLTEDLDRALTGRPVGQ